VPSLYDSRKFVTVSRPLPPMRCGDKVTAVGKNVHLHLACGHVKRFRGAGLIPGRTHCPNCEDDGR
jgi:hypothetical protein